MFSSIQPNKPQSPIRSNSLDTMPKLFSKAGTVLLIGGIVGWFLVVQLLGIYLFAPVVFSEQSLTAAQRFGMGSFNGTVTSYAMIFTFIVMLGTIYALITWRMKRVTSENVHLDKTHTLYSASNYLALKPFSYKVGLGILSVWVLFVLGSEVLTHLLDRDPTAFVDELYFTVDPKWLLIMVMVIIAPIYEEFMFRGILWQAIREQVSGRAGVIWASIITSIIFSIIHLQYEVFEMSVVFTLALLLSYARAKSGSLWLPIIIHIINNGLAMWLYLVM